MLPDLIRRVEALTGPDRAVDAEIAAALGILPDFDRSAFIVPIEYAPDERRGPGFVRAFWRQEDGSPFLVHSRPVPEFTASIDAALTLLHLPGHPLWTLRTETRSHGQHGMTYSAELCVPSREFQGYSRANLACALTAAALRARAEEGGDGR